jgi:anthraniloyl-CoA monooxygenase
MGPVHVAVLGGGPGGLLVARLLARQPGFEVSLHERLGEDASHGFGVALTHKVLDRLAEVDAEAGRRMRALTQPLSRWTLRRGSEAMTVDNRGGAAIGRNSMLRELRALATEAGARVINGVRASLSDTAQADIVIGADGVGSQTRNELAREFGASIEQVLLPYIWCGAPITADAMNLILERTRHGIFSAHAMPYPTGRSTFQVDTTTQALASAGFTADAAQMSEKESRATLDFLETTFAEVLGGQRLESGRAHWSTFNVIRCQAWSHRNVVLIGDAAHTAHYTVGSGTRMAMEDALALARNLVACGGSITAFASYEAERRPAVEHLQWRAERSQRWWGSLDQRIELPIASLMLSYFTRTGSSALIDIARDNPTIVDAALERVRRPGPASGVNGLDGRALAGHLLNPGDTSRFVQVSCDGIAPWSASATTLAAGSGDPVLLTGSTDRRQVLDRFDIAEGLRRVTHAPVAVVVPAELAPDAAVAVATERADFALLTTSS